MLGLVTKPSELPASFSLWRLVPALFVGLAVCAGLFGTVWHLERTGNQAAFRELADQRMAAVRGNAATALDMVALLAGHFQVSSWQDTNRQDFAHLVSPALNRHSYVQALEWIPRVPRNQRSGVEGLAQTQGVDGFRLTERDGDGVLVPAQERDEYFPVFYVQPVAGNERAQGYDLASDAVRRAALVQAQESGQLTLTGRVTLVQERGDQYGVLVFAPVYGAASGDVPSRRQNLTGYMLGVFRIGDLAATSETADQGAERLRMVDIHLFDLDDTPDRQRLFPKDDLRPWQQVAQGLYVEDRFDMAGRHWLMLATPGAAFSSFPAFAVGILALSLVAVLFYLFFQYSNLRRAEAAAAFIRQSALSRQRLAEAQRIAHVGHLEFDQALGVWSISDECAALLNVPNITSSRDIGDFLPEVQTDDAAILQVAIANGQEAGIDTELRVGDKILRVLGESPGAVHQQGHYLLTVQDITQQRAASLEREGMIHRIAEANRLEALGTLAGGIAHEINTPTQYISDNLVFIRDSLTSLLGVLDKVHGLAAPNVIAQEMADVDFDFLRSELPMAARQSLEGTDRIARIVRAVKEFSYPTSSLPCGVDLNRMVDTVAIVTRNQWKYAAEMAFDLQADLPQALAIEGEVNQVLVNLIVNAAYAIEEKKDGQQGQITVRTRALARMVEFSVTDTGVGISPENLRRIFELFFTTKPPGVGTGQGLAISQAIVNRHNGQMSVISTPGRGACFTVQLPRLDKADTPVIR